MLQLQCAVGNSGGFCRRSNRTWSTAGAVTERRMLNFCHSCASGSETDCETAIANSEEGSSALGWKTGFHRKPPSVTWQNTSNFPHLVPLRPRRTPPADRETPTLSGGRRSVRSAALPESGLGNSYRSSICISVWIPAKFRRSGHFSSKKKYRFFPCRRTAPPMLRFSEKSTVKR